MFVENAARRSVSRQISSHTVENIVGINRSFVRYVQGLFIEKWTYEDMPSHMKI